MVGLTKEKITKPLIKQFVIQKRGDNRITIMGDV
jgi:hypothetical protein